MTKLQTAVVGAALTGAAALALWFATKTDQPIIIGDSSVNVSHDSLTKKTSNEIEAHKAFHEVHSIKVVNGSDIVEKTVSVDNAEWYLTGAKGTVRVDHKPHFPGKGAFVTCASGWHGTGTLYVCNGDTFTPATLTFTDAHTCSINGASSCVLECKSKIGYCRLELEYK